MRNVSVAIAGGGASGTLLAAALVRRSASARVVIIEPRARLGAGVAYSTDCTAHLLNVPAQGMTAFPDDPQHFVRWLRENGYVNYNARVVRSAPGLRRIPRHHRGRDPARRPRHPRACARHRRRTSRRRRTRNVLQRRIPRSRDPRPRIRQCRTRIVAAHFRGCEALAAFLRLRMGRRRARSRAHE